MFFEDKKILSVEDSVVPGFKRVHVEYEKGSDEAVEKVEEKFEVPEWELTVVSSEEKRDASYGRYMRELYVTSRMYNDVFKALSIRADEIPVYIRRLLDTCQENEEKAVAAAFGVENRSDIRISDWHKEEKEVVGDEPVQD